MSPLPFLIEISSEAGRKVGGIYTVLQSKARFMQQAYPGRYLLVGRYDELCLHDIKFEAPPAPLEAAFGALAREGIFCHWGHWTYGDHAPAIMVDARNFGERLAQYEDGGAKKTERQVNYAKFLLWKHFGIDSLMDASPDFSENVVWGWAVGMLLERLCRIRPYANHAIVAQFHEWISGAGLLYCRWRDLPIATVFTTHATVLGRSLSSSGVDVLASAQSASGAIEVSEAYRLKVEGKHQLEMMAAKKCHAFTSVSETVALECRYVLGRYPDVITLNGLDFEQAEAEAAVRDLSAYMRAELLQVAEACFIPYYVQRYDNMMLLFISGRYEFTNKGFDIYIAALGKLNARIRKRGRHDGRSVVGFIFAPSAVRGPKISVIKNYLLLDKIMEVLDQVPGMKEKRHANLQERLAAIAGQKAEGAPGRASALSAVKGTLKADLDTMASGFIRDGERPHINLFDLAYGGDEIIRACVAAGLTNAPDDAVKVLFYPTYLRPNDGLMNMNYYDVISGMDVGIFPSRYEPFGYTPLEAGLKLNVAVSSDSAGFGRYLQSQVNLEDRGVRVLKLGAGGEAAAEELAGFLEDLYYSHHSQLEAYKEDSYRLMHLFDWKRLIGNYLRAHELALQRGSGSGKGAAGGRRAGAGAGAEAGMAGGSGGAGAPSEERTDAVLSPKAAALERLDFGMLKSLKRRRREKRKMGKKTSRKAGMGKATGKKTKAKKKTAPKAIKRKTAAKAKTKMKQAAREKNKAAQKSGRTARRPRKE